MNFASSCGSPGKYVVLNSPGDGENQHDYREEAGMFVAAVSAVSFDPVLTTEERISRRRPAQPHAR